MKITIKCSPKELVEFAKVLGGTENAEKKHELPSLLTELAKDEKINKLAEAIRNADKENAPQAEAAEQEVPFLVRDFGDRGHRKHVKQNSCESKNRMNDND